jgi:hypothetical protein
MYIFLLRFNLIFLLFSIVFNSYGQDYKNSKSDYHYLALEYSLGKTSTANVNFPEAKLQQGLLFSLGKTHNSGTEEWAKQLNYPQSGWTLSYVDMGNTKQLGQAITAVPFIDFKVFPKWTSRMNLKIGMGVSYFNIIYDENSNPNNKAITTHFTWAFRTNLYYNVWDKETHAIKLGLGYFHNSNGHMRLPNNGLNTFLVSAYSELKFNKNVINDAIINNDTFSSRTSQRYYYTRLGLGKKVLSKYNTDKKDVYAFSAATGKLSIKPLNTVTDCITDFIKIITIIYKKMEN